jgi:hypothetical protein
MGYIARSCLKKKKERKKKKNKIENWKEKEWKQSSNVKVIHLFDKLNYER